MLAETERQHHHHATTTTAVVTTTNNNVELVVKTEGNTTQHEKYTREVSSLVTVTGQKDEERESVCV